MTQNELKYSKRSDHVNDDAMPHFGHYKTIK